MKKFVFAILVSSLLLTLCFVYNVNIPSVKGSTPIYQGDLVLTGNNVTTLEGRFDINGSIIVEDNATLSLKNCYLNLTQSPSYPYNIKLRNPLNGNPRLLAFNSTIAYADLSSITLYDNSTAAINNSTTKDAYFMLWEYSNITVSNSSSVYSILAHESTVVSVQNSTIQGGVNIYNNSSANIQNSTIHSNSAHGDSTLSISSSFIEELRARNSPTFNIHNSTVDYLSTQESPEIQVYDSEIDSLRLLTNSTKCTISNLEPGLLSHWNFISDCNVNVYSGGYAPNVTFTDTHINGWHFAFSGDSNYTITNSSISYIEVWSFSTLYLYDSFCDGLYVYSTSYLYDTHCSVISLYDNGTVWLMNSTYSNDVIRDFCKMYLSWYLDVHVVDSLDQAVPSASVSVSYPNSTVADSKLTDSNGLARFPLMEKMMNDTGEYPIGDYNVEATYESYISGTTVNLTETKQVTLTFGSLVIPELSSLVLISAFITLTIVVIIVNRRKHAV